MENLSALVPEMHGRNSNKFSNSLKWLDTSHTGTYNTMK